MTERKSVFRRRKVLMDRSHSTLVTGQVKASCRRRSIAGHMLLPGELEGISCGIDLHVCWIGADQLPPLWFSRKNRQVVLYRQIMLKADGKFHHCSLWGFRTFGVHCRDERQAFDSSLSKTSKLGFKVAG